MVNTLRYVMFGVTAYWLGKYFPRVVHLIKVCKTNIFRQINSILFDHKYLFCFVIGMTNTRAREMLDSGYRMPAPDDTPGEMYDLMLKCWNYEAEARPHFNEIHSKIESLFSRYMSNLFFRELKSYFSLENDFFIFGFSENLRNLFFLNSLINRKTCF